MKVGTQGRIIMARDIPVGNGTLLVNFDEDYCLRDLYFPSIGKENQTDGHKSRFGVWVDGAFSWVSREWNISFEYVEESLVTRVTASNEKLGVALVCNDLVDYAESMYIKRLILRNQADREREFRIFFNQDFNILGSSAANTAYYDPDEKAIIHYKERRYFLVTGMRNSVQGIDQYATGIKEFHGMQGTWMDAEDGILSGNPIAQGSVDSTLSFTVKVPPMGAGKIEYWICAGKNYDDVRRLNKMILGHGLEHFTQRTDNYWKAWVNKERTEFPELPDPVEKMYKKSLLIMQTNIDKGGAIIAGTDSDISRIFTQDTYAYMWPRDSAVTAYALDRAGYQALPRRFFEFCYGIITQGKESLGGYFLHKYNPDGSLGSSWQPWVSDNHKILPIQEDSTALVLWALWRHFDRYRNVEFVISLFEHLIMRCGDFLASYLDDATGLPLPSYDLWEEKWGIHTYTVSAIYGGIKAAERFAEFFREGRRKRIYERAAARVKAALEKYLYSREHRRFLKTINPVKDGSFERDLTVDASTYAPFYFGVYEPDDERVVNTMHAIIDTLWVKTPIGGLARYENDTYNFNGKNAGRAPGNPWFVCTLWLAQWYVAKAKNLQELHEADRILEWAAKRALPSGIMAEQIDPVTGQPLSVMPLTWSHATYLSAVLEYMEKERRLKETEVAYAESRR